MKNFLYDLIASQPNADGAFHGGGKYAKKVFFELLKNSSSKEWVIFAIYDSSISLDDEIRKSIEEFNVILLDVKGENLLNITKKFDIQRFYTALPFGVITYKIDELIASTCEVFVTIHGLRSLETGYPTEVIRYTSSLKEKIKALLKRGLEKRLIKRDANRYLSLIKGTNIVTVSNHTKYALMSFFPHLTNEVQVFYSPDVTEFEDLSADEEAKKFNLSGYFLMVSGNRWLKNNLRSVMAIDEIFTERKEINKKVIITGVSNPMIYLDKIKNKDRFIFYKYVSEGFLNILYKNAYAFIYMTLNEGFGYPPLEAMKAGIPVITSPFTSLTEVCGDAVLYANPYAIKEIKSRILWILDDEKTYKELSEKSLKQFAFINKIQKEHIPRLVSYLLN